MTNSNDIVYSFRETNETKQTNHIQDSLGGNTLTTIIATISPCAASAEETASTLYFADRAAQVLVSVRVNEVEDNAVLLARSRRQIKKLKRVIRAFISAFGGTMDGPVVGGENWCVL